MNDYRKFPDIQVNRNPSMADEEIKISVEGLKPNQKVTLYATTTLANGAIFESFAQYISNETGNVMLELHGSHGGTYTGVEPMGLLWSLIPSSLNKRKHERFIVKDPNFPFIVKISLYDSFVPSLEDIRKCSPLNEISITRWYKSAGTKEYEIKEGRIRATLYIPPGKGPFRGVISMSGIYPGAMKHKASLLASHGFATLALKYFGTDDLPSNHLNLDVEYFEEAAIFLSNHPDVDSRTGVAIVANCYSTSISFALASLAPPGLINCFVCINGFWFAGGNFKYKGKTWKKAIGAVYKEVYSDGTVKEFNTYPGQPNEFVETIIPHYFGFPKHTNVAYMMITAGRDAALDVIKVVDSAKILFPKEILRKIQFHHYPDAGHLLEHAYSPHGKVAWTFGKSIFYGGIQPDHERAQEDSWNVIIEFLNNQFRQLKSNY